MSVFLNRHILTLVNGPLPLVLKVQVFRGDVHNIFLYEHFFVLDLG
jgi:hypothetical protein